LLTALPDDASRTAMVRLQGSLLLVSTGSESRMTKTAPVDLTTLGLDWRLAAQRLAKDVRDDFWPDPLGFKDLLGGPAGSIAERLRPLTTNYVPGRGVSYHIPKENFTIRDSIHISALDRLVYQALIDRLIGPVDRQLSPRVYSHRLRGVDNKWIFRSGVAQWKTFHDAVKTELRSRPTAFLIVTDVARYFETIQLKLLRLQLESMLPSSPSNVKDCLLRLMSSLFSWTPYKGYGLVQNVDASSFGCRSRNALQFRTVPSIMLLA